MIINVGSKNQAKVDAVRELIVGYPTLAEARINSINVTSGVSDQPKSLDETIQGAVNRARAAYTDCHYSIGLESGLMAVPHTKSGYLDFCACAIYNGDSFAIGTSGGFEFPSEVMRLITTKGMDASEAARASGITESAHIGSENGLIGIVSRDRVTRKSYTMQALQMALVQIEFPELY